jgi:hypothetical protein
MNVTNKLLAAVSPKGRYLVVELIRDHAQPDCTIVPKGTRGVIKGQSPARNHVFVFPHTVLNETKLFSDGDVRIVPTDAFKPIGRVG